METIDTEKYGVLYVDDEPDNLTVFKAAFRRHYHVHVAASAKEGMALLGQHDIQLIITDQRMPGTTGVEFLKTAVREHPKIIRMIMTGYSDIEVVIQSINEGHVYRYITKPWDKNELKMIIDNALETYRLKDENQQLLDRLTIANQKLEEYAAGLEEKVRQRTQVLEKNMALLESEILERKKVENNIRASEQAAAAANATKSRFVARISHDIRTPINAILGFVQLMQMQCDKPNCQTYLEAIASSGEMLLNLVNDIMDLSRLEVGKLKMEYAYVDLHAIMKDIEQIFLWKVKDKGLEFSVEVDASVPRKIIMDEARLRQILFNLLGNAFKFTKEGFIKLSVLKCEEHQDKDQFLGYVISVQDSGCGIPAEHQKEIFSEYASQSKLDGKELGGVGLGLAISKSLAELMGCRITLESEVNVGSDFRIHLADNSSLADVFDLR